MSGDSLETLILITEPPGLGSLRDSSPFEAVDPDGLVYFCFFREVEDRAELLKRLRQEAGFLLPETADKEVAEQEMSEEFTSLQRAGSMSEAFLAAMRWRTVVHSQPYHCYSLKVEYAPYGTSCIIAFRELGAEAIRENVKRALTLMEAEKTRVLDFFGLTGQW